MKELTKYIYRAYRIRYKSDVDEINYIRQNLKEGDIAIDIGAHKGGYLYWMQKRVKQKGKIYAFEPQTKLFKYLNMIVQLRNYQNVTIENLGLSSKENEVDFFIPKTSKGDSPGARIGALMDEMPFDEFKIQTTTLDNYFYKRQIKPNLIKIDVEGHEKEVLLGGLQLLKSCYPSIVMECENRHLKEGNIFDVFNILIELGYEGYFFENRKLQPLKNFKVEIHQKNGTDRFWTEKGYVNNFIFER